MKLVSHILLLLSVALLVYRAAQRGWFRKFRNPIVLKEALVSSRRRRFYLLRLGYLAVMIAFVAAIWMSQVPSTLSAGSVFDQQALEQMQVVVQAKMADLGKRLVAQIAWFQFVAVQVVVAVLMSNSVNAEVQKRTLTALLTTPLSFFQLAWGKSLAGIWQVVMLLACSLPLLALLRVFGGVSIDFIVETFYLTVASAFLSAAIAFQMSALFSQPYVSAGMSILLIAVFHGMSFMFWPAIAIAFLHYTANFSGVLDFRGGKAIYWAMVVFGLFACIAMSFAGGGSPSPVWLSPLWSMIGATQNLMSPRTIAHSSPLAAWAAVVIALGILKRADKTLADIAHNKAWGERPYDYAPAGVATNADDFWADRCVYMPDHADDPEFWNRPSERAKAEMEASKPPEPPAEPVYGRCERMGSAILWKDWRDPLFRNDTVKLFLFFMPALLGAIAYLCLLLMGLFNSSPAANGVLLSMLMSCGGVLTCGLSAMTIAAERQSGTWALLQTSLWSDAEIFLAKSAGVFARTWPLWALAIAHTLAFCIVGVMPLYMLVVAPLQIVMIAAFALAAGAAIGTRVRQSSIAMMAGTALAAGLWLAMPWLSVLICRSGVNVGGDFWKLPIAALSPPLQDSVLLRDGGGPWAAAAISLAAYGLAAALVAIGTMRRFRRNAFE